MCFWGSKKSKLSDNTDNLENTREVIKNIALYNKKNDYCLIVDDNYTNRLVLEKYLKRSGIKSHQSVNGKDVLDMIKEYGVYKVIWMDLQMPVMDGIECTKYLRKNNYKGIIIGVTGNVDEDSIKLCMSIGMNEIIPKPINKKILQVYFDKYIHNI